MPVTRMLLTACCVLFAGGPTSAAQVQPLPGKPAQCPPRPVECQVDAPVFNFGRQEMSSTSSPIFSNATISVTCTRSGTGFAADVSLELKGLPPQRSRRARDGSGAYLTFDMFVDPARTRLWGDGTAGTETFAGSLLLNDRNRVGTVVFVVYGKVDGRQTVEPGPFLGAVLSRVDYTVDCR